MLPISFWSILLQAAVPIGVELTNDVLALFSKQQTTAAPLTPDDWNGLGVKWASASNEQKAREAIARAGLK